MSLYLKYLLLHQNVECVKMLLDMLHTSDLDDNNTPTLGALNLEHFAHRKVTVEAFMKPFIHVWKWGTVKTEKGFKWPRKGDIA
jgi:hypothetical protein